MEGVVLLWWRVYLCASHQEVLRAEEEGRPLSNVSSFWSNPTGKGRSGAWKGGSDGYNDNSNGGIRRRGGGSYSGGGWRGGDRDYSHDDHYASAGNAQRDGFEGSGKGRGRRRGRGGKGGRSRSGGRGGFSAPYSTTPANEWPDLGGATTSQSNNGVNNGNSGWGKPEPEVEPAAGGGNDVSKGWGEPDPPATMAETGGSGSSFQSNGNSSGWGQRQQSGRGGPGASEGIDGERGGGGGMGSRRKGRGSAPAGRNGKRGTGDRGGDGGTWGRQNSATSSTSAPADGTLGGSGWGEPDISGTVGEDDGGWGSKPESGKAAASATSTVRSNQERPAPPASSPRRSSSSPLTANAKQWTGAGVDDTLTSASTSTPAAANAGEDMMQNSAVEAVGMAAATGAVDGGAGTMPLLVPSFFPSVGATPLGAPGLVEGATNTGIDPLIHLPQEQLAALIHAQQQQLVVQVSVRAAIEALG